MTIRYWNMAQEFNMKAFALWHIIISLMQRSVSSTLCHDVTPCNCRLEPEIKIDCTGMDVGDFDFSSVYGGIVNELVFRNIRLKQLPTTTYTDVMVNKIDISNTKFNNLAHFLQNIDESVEELRMDNAGVSMETLQYVRRFENLTLLSIKSNNLDLNRLPHDVFSYLHTLDTLYLSFNRFFTTSVNINVFKEMTSLRVLHLKATNINFLHNDNLYFLKDMKRLEELNLDQNTVEKQRQTITFSPMFKNLGLVSLKRLSLRSNNIIRFQNDSFSGIESLEVLVLSDNVLHVVPDGLNSTLFRLREFNINNNKIMNVVERQFYNNSLLTSLSLRDNKLQTLPGSFLGLGHLQTLDLSSNELRSGFFWITALQPLMSLAHLNISFNNLKYIQNDSFDSTVNLNTLDISGNPLTFTDTMFSGIEWSLKNLYIRNVGLARTPLVPLKTLTELQVLDLSENKFLSLEDFSFKGIKVHSIYLKNMNISTISNKAFAKSMFQLSVYLDNNNITALDFLKHSPSCVFGILSLTNNPLSCDCDIFQASASGRLGAIRGRCTNDEFNGIDFTDVDSQKKLCPKFSFESGRCSKTGRFISNSASLPYKGFHSLINLVFICKILANIFDVE